MFDKKLIKEARKYLRDWEKSHPANIMPDYSDDTWEGSAYLLIAKLVSEGQEINAAIEGENI